MSNSFTVPTQTAANALLALSDRARRDPVWKGAKRGDTKFFPMTRADRDRLWHRARHKLGNAHTRNVFYSLLFDFFSVRTGRCDPSWAALARAACCSLSTVYRRLRTLRDLKLLNWEMRCTGSMQDGRYQLEQDTNAYHFDPAWGEVAGPLPRDIEIGKPERVPDTADLVRQARSPDELVKALKYDPDDKLAAALLRLKPKPRS